MAVIGGGATGLGTALDAASRGFRTLLLEAHDFASGTSSKATNLVHGGVRYLAQGNVALVREALHERGVLMRNAPHLVWPLGFVIPAYRHWDKMVYGAGLKVYDALAGRLGMARSKILSKDDTLDALPTLSASGLRGGVMYFDGQFDDARLAIALARTAADQGALLLNYVSAGSLVKDGGTDGRITGVEAKDAWSGEKFRLNGRCVINAAGVWADSVRQLDQRVEKPMLSPSQGVHLVLSRSFLPSDFAMLVPRTKDGRVLFVVPWHGHTLVGTTDTPRPDMKLGGPDSASHSDSHTPVPLHEEIDFILQTVAPYLMRIPTRADVLSAWAGLRPLVNQNPSGAGQGNTAKISREHTVVVSRSGLVTVTGGKWTTYRKMAETVVDTAMQHGLLEQRPCCTETLRLHADAMEHQKSRQECPDKQRSVSKVFYLTEAAVRHAVWHEYALTVEDVLARRHRALLLNAAAAVQAAPRVAALLADELGLDEQWVESQVRAFTVEAQKYFVDKEEKPENKRLPA